jgi:hypothetical protein
MNSQVITGTLVLVAHEAASQQELCDAAEQATAVHGRSVVVILPHNWQAMPVELARSQLDAIESRATLVP